ncbi:MAG: serine/threonine-protein phosphatase [Opitutales bacterium]|nr:serine/threonine-protein phosphatase [Opitutales bacterium]
MKKLSSIRVNIFFAMMFVVAVLASILLPYGLYSNANLVRDSFDERLKVAAESLAEIIPENFEKEVESGLPDKDKIESLRKKISNLKNGAGLTSLCALYKNPQGKICYLIDEIFVSGQEMENPNEKIAAVFQTKEPEISRFKDAAFDFMARTALVPIDRGGGSFFVGMAEIETASITPILKESLDDFFLLILFGAVAAVFAAARVSGRVSHPLRRLSAFTEKLAKSNFDKSLNLADTLPESQIRSTEVKTLSDNIAAMRENLYKYIDDFEKEARARTRIEADLKIAGKIQQSFLPQKSYLSDKIEIAADMKSAREAGGDLYCIEELPGGSIAFAIGDVSGKGIPAAMFMARIITLARAALRNGASLDRAIKFLNRSIAENNETCTFVTFFLAIFEPEKNLLSFINCGHNPPALRRANGKFAELEVKPNSILGVFEGAEFEAQTLPLNPGDAIFLYTDGITEASNASGEFFGKDRLLETLNASRENSAKSMVDAAVSCALKFEQNAPQSDDITAMAVVAK